MVDFTPVWVAAITGFFGVMGILLPLLINSRMKDSRDAAAMSAAVKNSLGALEQATLGIVVNQTPPAPIPGVPEQLLPAVDYALTHAGPEFKRAGISPLAVASKINAQIGLQARAGQTASVPPATAIGVIR